MIITVTKSYVGFSVLMGADIAVQFATKREALNYGRLLCEQAAVRGEVFDFLDLSESTEPPAAPKRH